MEIIEFCGHSGIGKSTALAKMLEEKIFDSRFKVLTDIILGKNIKRLKLQTKRFLQSTPFGLRPSELEYKQYINYGLRMVQQRKSLIYFSAKHRKLVELIEKIITDKNMDDYSREILLSLQFASFYFKNEKDCKLYLDEGLFQLFEPIIDYDRDVLIQILELYPVQNVVFMENLDFEELYERLIKRNKKTFDFINLNKEQYRKHFERKECYYNWLKRELPLKNVNVIEYKNGLV